MHKWLIVVFLLTACTSSTTPTQLAPTITKSAPTTIVTTTTFPDAESPIPTIVPAILYQYNPSLQYVERINDTNRVRITTGIPAQFVVANHDHSRLAIHTKDDTTMVYDVTSAQTHGPFDTCDSLTWAPDTTTVWCMRLGHLYTIDTTTQTDQLSVTAPNTTQWEILTQHPVTDAYWMLTTQNSTQKLCQYNPITASTTDTCIDAGSMVQWSPDGHLIAFVQHQRLMIHSADGKLDTSVGLGDLTIVQLVWQTNTQLILTTPTHWYTYQINDARISLQAPEVIIVGR